MNYGKIKTELSLEQFVENYSYLLAGGYATDYAETGEASPEPLAFESLEAFSAWYGDYAEEDVYALLRMKDGRYATLTASCDTTGYDCKGYVSWHYYATLEEAVNFGLTEGARDALFGEEDDNE